MSQSPGGMSEFHWLIEVLQTVDIGIVVLDLDYNITAWNGFIENNSGVDSADAIGRSLFDVFSELSEQWFKHKAETVIQLRNRAFTTWEQRPYVFKFKNTRPVTGMTPFMYQNTTFIPVIGPAGEVQNLAIIVYDVSDTAISKLELKGANDQLAQLSRTDGLTQLLNRGHWEELLEAEFMRQQRKVRDMSLVMLDIDHFKEINDNYGHQTGDEVLRAVAKLLQENSRASDYYGRYGGEEFALLLRDSDTQSAMQFAERLRETVEQTSFHTAQGKIKLTISLGVAGWNDQLADHRAWMKVADQALYQSKNAGRNQITLAGTDQA